VTSGFDNTDGIDGQEASLRLEPEDLLEDHSGADVLELGYAPQDRPWAVDGWGVTAREQAEGRGLEAKLARELPDGGNDDADEPDDGLGDIVGTDGELRDNEVGDRRAGRLLEISQFDDGDNFDFDSEDQLLASDEGLAGGGASAEEAAIHIVPDA
jgi:hypothetical protein